jgi:hypothetical protein
MMNNWSNKIITGLITGIVSPPAGFYIFCLFVYPGESALELLQGYARRHVLTHVISLSVLFNLALFFIFLNTKREISARGVLGATFIYAFIVLILKLT